MFELLFGLDTLAAPAGQARAHRAHLLQRRRRAGQAAGRKGGDRPAGGNGRRASTPTWATSRLGFSNKGVTPKGGHVNADLILFMPGLTGPAWAPDAGLPLSPGGFFKADEFCRVAGADKVFVAGDAGSYPGPDWLPKQAHMADLQAKAAAENLLLALDGKAPTARFKIELICIVDTLSKGILVYRDLKRGFLLPPSRLMHWAKRYFEGHYLKVFRR
jgi:sulfide:quinone oxidoreductase